MDNTGHITHKLALESRKRMTLTGIKDVQSFDDKLVILDTSLGVLVIKGNELHINRLSLDKGDVDLEGRVDAMEYADKKEEKSAGSILGRLFG